ncbi:MAG: hypothetical protein IJ615_02590 [Bacteroidaceae bacterium]|nr:hypothetical protein [Bacteroidaceae bacterium]
MKTRYISLLSAALLWGTALAGDDNSFYFTDAAVLPGGQTSIELCMRSSATDLTCLEAEVQLPEGLSLVCDEEGIPVATLYRNRVAGHDLQAGILENGNLKLLVSDIDGSLFGGEEGPILSFRVQASASAPTGEYTLQTTGESLLVNTSAEAFYSTGVTGNVLVTDDATSIASHLSETEGTLPVYNLSGQRIARKQRGVNIVGRRKELNK